MYTTPRMNTLYSTFLAQKNLKNTAQRKELFYIVMAEKSHFSVDQLAEKTKGKIGVATLYRFLRLMVDAHLIHEYHFGEKTLFEPVDGNNHHDHIICEQCGTIEEFYSPEIEKIQEQIIVAKGFTLTSHRHELYGLCKKCAQ